MGTPEVNIYACFLHGLVQDFYFGRSPWPPDLGSTGDKMFAARQPYLRNPADQQVNNGGAVFLLKNPWNPRYRVLWVAGLTGCGTGYGCSLVAANWFDYREAKNSIGVVFARDPNDIGDQRVAPRSWLRWSGKTVAWQKPFLPGAVQNKTTQAAVPTPRFQVFLSYSSKDEKNRQAVQRLKTRLADQGLTVWYDGDQLRPGISWQQGLETGIKSSASVAVLVGQDRIGPWERVEMEVALQRALREKRAVIPVLLPGPPRRPGLPMFLGTREWVDLHRGLTDKGIQRLVWGITGRNPDAR
jgi:hypothetical protein